MGEGAANSSGVEVPGSLAGLTHAQTSALALSIGFVLSTAR